MSGDGRRLVASTINTYQEQPWGYGDRFFLSDDDGASWVNLTSNGRMSMDAGEFPWLEDHAMH